MVEQLRAGRYKHTEFRRGHRNGYRYRSLLTKLGLVERLKVPRDREGQFQPSVIVRYQRRQDKVNSLIRESFLGGLSTRRIGEVLEPVLGEAVSPETVSRITRSLEREVERYHERPLGDDYRYLIFDGIVLKVKSLGGGVKKKLVLCAYGITVDGQREILSFRQATAESEAQWEAFLRDLYERGVKGKNLKLVVADGCAGLAAALETVFPYVPRQHCWVHKLRNVSAKLPKKVQKECMSGARKIYLSSDRGQAMARFHRWCKDWRPTQTRAVTCLERDLQELLNFFDCPEAHRIKVRTTNAIERSFREVRRRTRPMSCFQNSKSVDRIVYGVISHLNTNWKVKHLAGFTHNT